MPLSFKKTEDAPDLEVTASKDRPRSRARHTHTHTHTHTETRRPIVCFAFSSASARDRALAQSYFCRSSRSSSPPLPAPSAAMPSMPSKWTDGHAKWRRTKKKRGDGNSAECNVVRLLTMSVRAIRISIFYLHFLPFVVLYFDHNTQLRYGTIWVNG